jgi:hypothetical protein
MPYKFEIEPARKILRVAIEGVLTDDVLKECYEQTRERIISHGAVGAMLVLTGVTETVLSTQVIHDIAMSEPLFRGSAMRVIVAQDDYLYGLSRMFQMESERTRDTVRVVHTVKEAYNLLGLENPQFKLID